MKLRAISRIAGTVVITSHMLVEMLLRQKIWPKNSEKLGYKYKRRWARKLMRLVGIRVIIRNAPPESTKGLLIVCNHRSYVDIPLLMSQVDCSMLSKAEVADWPVFGVAARKSGTLFVDRSSPESRAATLEAVGRRLKEGQTVLVFPEGTTIPGPDIGNFRKGLFQLAGRMGIPVLPVALHYTESRMEWVGDDEFMPHFMRNFSKKRAEVHLSFGPIISTADGVDLRQQAEDWVRERVGWLQNEIQTNPV